MTDYMPSVQAFPARADSCVAGASRSGSSSSMGETAPPAWVAIFAFLRAIGLAPVEWSQAVAATGKASPYISEVIDSAIETAQAVVVLWTPDEIVSLTTEYADGDDDPEVLLTVRLALTSCLRLDSRWGALGNGLS